MRGLRGGDILTTLAPQKQLEPGQTLLVGIVTDNEDPEGWGRVKVKFPTLTEEHASNWARVVAIGEGKERGFDCLPEINDEVLVAFEQGDIHRPYILGAVWNGKDKTPNPVKDAVVDGKVRLRTFKTRVGHKIQFVEEDKGSSKKGACIETAGGHKILINDSEKFVEIKTSGGQKFRLDDSKESVEIETSGGQNLKLDDSGGVSINSKGGISIQGAGPITLNSTGGPITLKTAQSAKVFS